MIDLERARRFGQRAVDIEISIERSAGVDGRGCRVGCAAKVHGGRRAFNVQRGTQSGSADAKRWPLSKIQARLRLTS